MVIPDQMNQRLDEVAHASFPKPTFNQYRTPPCVDVVRPNHGSYSRSAKFFVVRAVQVLCQDLLTTVADDAAAEPAVAPVAPAGQRRGCRGRAAEARGDTAGG